MKKVNHINFSCIVIFPTDGFVAFESALQKGHYLGVLENGQVKQPVKVDAPNNYDLFDIKNAER